MARDNHDLPPLTLLPAGQRVFGPRYPIENGTRYFNAVTGEWGTIVAESQSSLPYNALVKMDYSNQVVRLWLGDTH